MIDIIKFKYRICTNNNAKGGDIDLFIESNQKMTLMDKLKLVL